MTLLIDPQQFRLPQISSTTVLLFNLQHFFMLKELTQGGKVKSFGPVKRFNFELEGQTYTALGGMIGAPLAVLNVENALAAGSRNFITFGTAGWLAADQTAVGTVVTPDGGIDETGMSGDYGNLTAEVCFAPFKTDIPVCGKIVSINSFYRTTLEKVKTYREQRVDLIDMEAAPLHYIISQRGGMIRSLFVISDRFSTSGEWTSGMGTAEFQQGVENGLQHVLQLLRS